MDSKELRKLYLEKLGELEAERGKLGELFHERDCDGKPLTDAEILRQNEHCGDISLEVSKLKALLDELEDG